MASDQPSPTPTSAPASVTQPSTSVTRVLVATDRSPTAERAVGWAVEMAARYQAELWLLQVLLPEDPTAGPSAMDRSRVSYAEQELERDAERLAGPRGRARVVVDDDPAAAIVEAAEEERIDLIVVGNAGMSGRKEFLLGNVPNRVSHNAQCTVVIVNSAAPASESQPRGLRRLLRRDR